jgi:hypothetical protein
MNMHVLVSGYVYALLAIVGYDPCSESPDSEDTWSRVGKLPYPSIRDRGTLVQHPRVYYADMTETTGVNE